MLAALQMTTARQHDLFTQKGSGPETMGVCTRSCCSCKSLKQHAQRVSTFICTACFARAYMQLFDDVRCSLHGCNALSGMMQYIAWRCCQNLRWMLNLLYQLTSDETLSSSVTFHLFEQLLQLQMFELSLHQKHHCQNNSRMCT